MNEIPLIEAIDRVDEIDTINSGIKTKIRRFAKIFEGYEPDDLPADALEHILDTTGYLENFRGQRTIEAQNRVENIEELRNAVYEYEMLAEEPTLSDYLENVALIADIDTMKSDDTDETNIVTLMTLHSAKGLEFPFVFMVGMEEGYLPHQRSECTESGLEEERRVCYVGITRAMEQLYLVHAQARRTWSGVEYRVPSRFIEEISPDVIRHVDRYNSAFSQPNTTLSQQEINYIKEEQTEKEDTYGVGQIVYHSSFGRGKVTQLSKNGSNTYVTVRFDRPGAGSKQFDADMAQLQTVL